MEETSLISVLDLNRQLRRPQPLLFVRDTKLRDATERGDAAGQRGIAKPTANPSHRFLGTPSQRNLEGRTKFE